MSGLKRLCKAYGSINFTDNEGNTEIYVYDYVKDKPVRKSEMTKEEWELSEKEKWNRLISN